MDQPLDALLDALRGVGFQVTATRRDMVHLRRRVGQRDDHVAVTLRRRTLVSRLMGHPGRVRAVAVGQVWRLVEQAFNRPVPAVAMLPDDAHVATDLDAGELQQAAGWPDLVAAIGGWCDTRPTPADVLAEGLPTDPYLRLDFAVVARDRAAGLAAVAAARADLAQMTPSQRRRLERHVDLAEARLP